MVGMEERYANEDKQGAEREMLKPLDLVWNLSAEKQRTAIFIF